MWAGPLHNHDFVTRLQETVSSLEETVYVTRPRMLGMLSMAAEVTHTQFFTNLGIGRTVLSDTSRTSKNPKSRNPTSRYSLFSSPKCRIQCFIIPLLCWSIQNRCSNYCRLGYDESLGMILNNWAYAD